MAIISEAKQFIFSPICQRIIDAIWSGKIVYTSTAITDIVSDRYKTRPISLYNPRNTPSLNHYRLTVPRNDKFASILQHGWLVFIANLWNGFDATFLLGHLSYLSLRIIVLSYQTHYQLKSHWLNYQSHQILSCLAILIFPRLAFSILSHNILILSLRSMLSDFIFLVILGAWCFLGFGYSLYSLQKDNPIVNLFLFNCFILFSSVLLDAADHYVLHHFMYDDVEKISPKLKSMCPKELKHWHDRTEKLTPALGQEIFQELLTSQTVPNFALNDHTDHLFYIVLYWFAFLNIISIFVEMSFPFCPLPSSLKFKKNAPPPCHSSNSSDDVMVRTKPVSVHHQNDFNDDATIVPPIDVLVRTKPKIEHHEDNNNPTNHKRKLT
ncbi:hypothetical protein O181_075832 [Austropuccinia psidii MF-1]|uniref:Uncharacterized protein n=1 Tax=Austropuccinia psidii MF-1 TaxID=1389203 RepID=A0A9Q3FFR1_9BASI|nr:hypothetical protein [Austropuccinia psidii MF-1]